MKRIFYILVIATWATGAGAQQLPIYSQYLYNKFLINPAVAGSDGFTSFNMTAREQWVGYPGAPQTFSLSGQKRFLKRSSSVSQKISGRQVYRPASDGRVGIGGLIFADKNGLVKRTGFQAAYSYHLWLQRSTQLSMGLAFTGYQFKIDVNQINFEDPNDPWLNNDLIRGVFVPDASFGIHILNPRYSAGFSADQLFGAALKIGSDAYEKFNMSRHFYLFGSYVFLLNNYTELQPSLLIRMSDQLKPQADIGLTYIYNQLFWGGLTYRTGGVIIANLGVRYQKFFFGYAFEYSLQEIQRITYGSHELTVAMRFGDNSRKYRWLDRY